MVKTSFHTYIIITYTKYSNNISKKYFFFVSLDKVRVELLVPGTV